MTNLLSNFDLLISPCYVDIGTKMDIVMINLTMSVHWILLALTFWGMLKSNQNKPQNTIFD